MIDFNKENDDLVKRLRMHDESAFNILYAALYPQVYKYCKKIIKEDFIDSSADVSINSIVKYWIRADQFDSLPKIRGFVLGVARNECFDILKKKMVSKKYLNTLEVEPTWNPFLEEEIRLSNERLKSAVLKSIVFDGQHGRIFDLKWMKGIPAKKIASKLGVSISTVHSHSSIAINKIRKTVKYD